MKLSALVLLITLVLVVYKSRDYSKPLLIWLLPVLIPVCFGFVAFFWSFIFSPSSSKRRRSLRQTIVALKAAYTKHDQTYQKYGWDRPAIHPHSPLFIAAEQGDCLRIHDLIQSGSGLTAEEHLGWTPLMIAAANGHEEAVRLLIRLGADPNGANSRGRTALMFASRYGFQKIANALIQAGADVNRVDAEGSPNALATASHEGHLKLVELLLANGADQCVTDSKGKAAVDLAKESGHGDIVTLLNNAKV